MPDLGTGADAGAWIDHRGGVRKVGIALHVILWLTAVRPTELIDGRFADGRFVDGRSPFGAH